MFLSDSPVSLGGSAKPDGVSTCGIWAKFGDPAPTDGKRCQFLALNSATPYVVGYDGSDGGKAGHYMLRWVTKGGEKLAWSETVSETNRA